MTRLSLSTLLLLLCGGALAQGTLSAPNCHLAQPPQQSGESSVHGVLLQEARVKVYPRRDQISSDYTGCQTAWGYHNSDWQQLAVLYFESGELRAVLDVPTQERCEYRDARLVTGNPTHCAKIKAGNVAFPSFAPGCLTDAISRGKMSDACMKSFDDPTQAPSRAADNPR